MNQFMFIYGFILLTAITGYKLKALTLSGAIAAVVAGLAVSLGFGAEGLFLLGAFAASSSIWSKYKGSEKKAIEEKLAKTSTRDWRQVAANGGGAGIFSLLNYIHPDFIWLIGFAVCIASANSDTWASEIGSLSRKKPIYIRTFKQIEPGTSGAVSLLGSIAALAGSLLIALLSLWLFKLDPIICLVVFLFGYFGNIIDTLIGAFYQQVYICKQCGLETEKRRHCGQLTVKIKGLPFIDNEMVNFLSGFLAAILAVLAIQIAI